jgi:hypothetical protein
MKEAMFVLLQATPPGPKGGPARGEYTLPYPNPIRLAGQYFL